MLECVGRVKQSKAALKKAVAELHDAPSMPPGGVWLCDNAMMLLGELTAFERYAKKNRRTDFGRIFDLCVKTASDGIVPTADRLTAVFAPALPSTAECAALIPALKAAYAAQAVRGYRDETVVSRCVKAVRLLNGTDAEELIAAVSETEKVLRADPAGAYPLFSPDTKERYREAVRRLARKNGTGEKEAALEALGKARDTANGEDDHIGFYLPFGERRLPPRLCLIGEGVLALLLCVLLCGITHRASMLFWLPLPVYAFVRCLSGVLLPLLFRPRQMFSYDGEAEGIYLPGAVIAVSSLLPDAGDAGKEYEHLAALRSSDSSPDTVVLALFDPKNSPEPFVSSDRADMNAMKDVINRLNADLGGGFVMALRDRVYSPTENEYTGHERKRGAIAALIRLLNDGENGFSMLCGDTEKLKDKRYVLALDSDTELSFEVLHRLLCIACHPLNKPRYDAAKRRIVRGYGCIAPRTETSLSSSCKTLFSTVFTSGGASAYSAAVSERYMDMFGTSLFTGKGLIDVKAYAQTCLGAFDDGIVLSHDIPEGALLRTGFAGDAVLTDAFPSSPASYFRRAERWIRGDIQNAPFLFRGTSRAGGSPRLPALAVYQLADNIRTALDPVFCLACILAGAFSHGAAGAVLLLAGIAGAAGEAVVSCLWAILSGGIRSLMRTFFSSSVSQSLRALLRAFFLLGSLPQRAAVSLDAVCRAVYRMTVSKKHTLQWTTASAAEKLSEKRPVCFIAIPAAAAAVLVCASLPAAAIGVITAAMLPFCLSDGFRLGRRTPALRQPQREILLSYLSSMWDFFADSVTADENHLPPDNIQETPVRRVAHRTSPTNIGLYLTSALAAADFSLITAGELYERLSATFATLGGLMKYKGLLYNWYDTKTLLPLRPLFVSTVDCGNFEVCLTALREGLREYARADGRFNELIDACGKLLGSGDMTALFDKKRGLFSIGLDVSGNRLSDSCYDLFMSESVMTSYYHIARRDIPVSHWAKLGRPLVKAGRYTAAVSWTGTMFEYFMPSLFLPVYENSFRYEALKVCLREQKLFAKAGQPFGVSESGYYAFDPSLSYRYRANGIRRLALKRGADCERIFSPYSAFLALSLEPTAALKDLSVFASLHAFGRYGFYEAADFSSPGSVPQDYMLIRSYMAHHVGMSILACANAINGNIFVKRFLRDAQMRSADSLLHEKLPFDVSPSPQLFRSREKKETPPLRASDDIPTAEDAGIFSNGEDSFVCDRYLRHRFLHSSVSVLGCSGRASGVFTAVGIQDKAPTVVFGKNASLRDTCCYEEYTDGPLVIKYAPALLNNHPVLAIPVKIKNTGGDRVNVSLYFYFEPELLPVSAPSEHPAFDAMLIRTGFDSRMNALTFARTSPSRPRAALAAGFYDGASFLFECDREKVLRRDPYRAHPFDGELPEFRNNTDCVSPCGAIRLSFELAAGKQCEKVLLLAAEETSRRALSVLAAVRAARLPDVRKAAPRLLKDLPFAKNLADGYARAVYYGERSPADVKAVNENTLPVSALWRFGISGDLPLISVYADELPGEMLGELIRLHDALNVTGSTNDLVFLTAFSGDYRNGIPEKLSEAVRKYSDESLVGERGGIHVLHTHELGESVLTLLRAMPGITFPPEDAQAVRLTPPSVPAALPGVRAGTEENRFVPNGYHIGTKGLHPWCHTLSNKSFGTLLSDSSLGYTWALNARQNKLTRWSNDVTSDMSGEKVLLKHGGLVFDTAAGADVTFYDDKAVYTSRCGAVSVRLTVSVDERAMKKRIRVKLSGVTDPGASLVYSVLPQLGENERDAIFVKRAEADGMLVLTNPAREDYRGYAAYYADEPFTIGEEKGRRTVGVKRNTGESETTFYNIFSRSVKGLSELRELPFREALPVRARFTEFSPVVNAFGSALLLHNAYDTRFTARTGFYQCSGAYGFRDQLQDACSVLPYYPDAARIQLLRSCAAQFPEGDVLHWYHVVPFPEPCFKGVRTHCSDDLLWLPLCTAQYTEATGDTALLKLPVAFLAGEPLAPGEKERYGAYRASGNRASVYEHCLRAVKHSFTFGVHGLPLIKAGDWNDAFSEVGSAFRGESVWLAEFLRLVCMKFAPVCEAMRDDENKRLLLGTAEKMKRAVLRHGFNGKYFIRGYYDDGQKLGDEGCRACALDILPQAFAVLSDIADGKRYASALSFAFRELYDTESKTLALFTPPFEDGCPRAGYVNDYPPGVRENGGQYTHAAVWFALALKKAGFREEAVRLCEILCPAIRYEERETGERFMNEPYVMTGDVCTRGGLKGRGGWSLYTGSAGWYLRLLNELRKE